MKHDSQSKSKTMKKSWVIFYAFIATLSFFTLSCNDDDNNNDTNKPELASILPAEAHVGETVTLNGKNFNDGATDTKVSIGGTACKVAGGTETTISVEVPELEAGTYDVTATVSGETTKSVKLKVLEAQVDPMKFTGFSPTEGKYQDVITISGENFDKDVKVKINNVPQTDITYVNSTTIKVNLAKQTGSGKVVLMREGESDVESDAVLKYTFTYPRFETVCKLQGLGIAPAEDGTMYLIYNDGLIRMDYNGNVLDTLIDFNVATRPEGVFIDAGGQLYIAQAYGMIFSLNAKKGIDTLFNDKSILTKAGALTGDNKGNLYISTRTNKSIVKFNIKSKTVSTVAENLPHGVSSLVLLGDTLFGTTEFQIFKLHVDDKAITDIIADGDPDNTGPSHMCYHPSGEFFISGKNTMNLYHFKNRNELVEIISKSELNNSNIYSIALDKDGNILLGGSNLQRVFVE